jgi:hypothetical protein
MSDQISDLLENLDDFPQADVYTAPKFPKNITEPIGGFLVSLLPFLDSDEDENRENLIGMVAIGAAVVAVFSMTMKKPVRKYKRRKRLYNGYYNKPYGVKPPARRRRYKRRK